MKNNKIQKEKPLKLNLNKKSSVTDGEMGKEKVNTAEMHWHDKKASSPNSKQSINSRHNQKRFIV
jgi:hypothetical protein